RRNLAVKRRPYAMAAAAAAAALVLAASTAPARADSLASSGTTTANYRLTSDHDIAAPDPNATGPQVIAEVVPPGSVLPPAQSDGSQASPLTILNTSSGFDQNHLIVALKDDVSNAAGSGSGSSSSPEQLFGLSFFGDPAHNIAGGFGKGGELDFSLNIDK